MSRNDVASFTINFTLPPEIIKEYCDGMARVEAAKKPANDLNYGLVSLLLASLVGKSSDTKNKEESTGSNKNSKVNTSDVTDLLNKASEVCDPDSTKGISDLLKSFGNLISKAGDNKEEDIKTENNKTEEVKSKEDKEEIKEEVKEEPKDCYEELTDLINNNKNLFVKLKKDNNIPKLYGIINNIDVKQEEVVKKEDVEVKKEDDVTEEKKILEPQPNQQSSQQPSLQPGQLPDMSNMMNSLGPMMNQLQPMMQGLMGNLQNMANGVQPNMNNDNVTTTVKDNKKNIPKKTMQEILEEDIDGVD